MKVKEIMAQPVVVVQEDTSLERVAQLMLEHRIGCVPVVDPEGKLCGIVTESDFTEKERGVPFTTFRAPQLFHQWVDASGVEKIYQMARTLTVKEIMSAPVVTVQEETPVEELLQLMLRHQLHRIPAVRDGVPVGLVARHDLLGLMLEQRMA